MVSETCDRQRPPPGRAAPGSAVAGLCEAGPDALYSRTRLSWPMLGRGAPLRSKSCASGLTEPNYSSGACSPFLHRSVRIQCLRLAVSLRSAADSMTAVRANDSSLRNLWPFAVMSPTTRTSPLRRKAVTSHRSPKRSALTLSSLQPSDGAVEDYNVPKCGQRQNALKLSSPARRLRHQHASGHARCVILIILGWMIFCQRHFPK